MCPLQWWYNYYECNQWLSDWNSEWNLQFILSVMTKTCVCQELTFSKETMSIIILNMCYILITFPLLSDLIGHRRESLIITFLFNTRRCALKRHTNLQTRGTNWYFSNTENNNRYFHHLLTNYGRIVEKVTEKEMKSKEGV